MSIAHALVAILRMKTLTDDTAVTHAQLFALILLSAPTRGSVNRQFWQMPVSYYGLFTFQQPLFYRIGKLTISRPSSAHKVCLSAHAFLRIQGSPFILIADWAA